MSDLHTIDLDRELDLIESNLTKLGVPYLVSCLDLDLVNSLDALDEPINSPNLARTIVSLEGTRVFLSKPVRDAFCEMAGLDKIQHWRSSKESRKLLNYYGLSEYFLPQKKEKREMFNNIEPNFVLHDYQEWMKKKVSNFLLSSEKDKLMIQLPTGAGKTSLMMESIYDYFRVSTIDNPMAVWMAHTDELCEQAIESFQRGWKDKGTCTINIIRLWGGNAGKIETMPDGPVFLVTSFQSAHSMIQTKNDKQFEVFNQINRRCNLLVADEAHMALAPTYNAAIRLFSKRDSKVIGLTATPGRHGLEEDNEETKKLVEFFQDNIIRMNEFCGGLSPIKFLQERNILSKVTRLPLVTNYEIDLSESQKRSFQETLSLPESALKKIGEDQKRNLTILSQIIKLRTEYKKKILVFATSKDNSNLLASLLLARGIKAKSITSESEFTDRIKSVSDFKDKKLDVLINYNVFTTGFDDPSIDCIVIARPTYSVILYSQMVGRGLRGTKNGGTPDCLLIDVIDNLVNQPDAELACNFFEREWKTNLTEKENG